MSDTTKSAILSAEQMVEIRDGIEASETFFRRLHTLGDEAIRQLFADARALLGHIDALTAELAEAHTRAVAPCRVDPFNSRACERGTKGCEARHWEPRARGEGSPT